MAANSFHGLALPYNNFRMSTVIEKVQK